MRDLATLLEGLHDGLVAMPVPDGLRVDEVSMTLPLELQVVLKDGGCRLLAGWPRTADAEGWDVSPSKLAFAWRREEAAP